MQLVLNIEEGIIAVIASRKICMLGLPYGSLQGCGEREKMDFSREDADPTDSSHLEFENAHGIPLVRHCHRTRRA